MCNPNTVRKLEVMARPHVSGLTCPASSLASSGPSVCRLRRPRHPRSSSQQKEHSCRWLLLFIHAMCSLQRHGEGNEHGLCPHIYFVTSCVALASAADVPCLE